MAPNGIVRRIDDLGRITIPKEIRRNMKLNDGDALEITYTNGTVSIRKYKKSFEQCAIDWYNKATNIHDNSDFNFRYFRNADFWRRGEYTFCVVGALIDNFTSRAGYAKRFEKDIHDERIGRVAAFARAMGRNLNKMIGYEG